MTSHNAAKWALYLRVSSEDKQSPERSFPMQRKEILEQLVEPSNLPVYREYQDILTGTNPNRSDYQQMLADAKAGKYSHLGLYRVDRFGRNMLEGLQAASQLTDWGIKIQVTQMPSLDTETPDGRFFFQVLMGMAQLEVDVLTKRSKDGIAAKLRSGGWAFKAPEGYNNKERLIKSGKYERWVEPDPLVAPAIRLAWDLLLTDRFTIDEICERLTAKGFVRSGDKPWAWTDSKNGKRLTARNRLHEIFHKPFYAGWVVSQHFDMPMGEVRGNWEPLITTDEYEKGIEILRKHDGNKLRTKRHFYLLRNLLWVQSNNGVRAKLYVSTPTGRNKSYSYYVSKSKFVGKGVRLPCAQVEEQIPRWLQQISVSSELIPDIRQVYLDQIQQVTKADIEERKAELRRRISELNSQEARLARVHITGNMTEETYKQLRTEWLEKRRTAENNLHDLENELFTFLDDLEVALVLLAKANFLYERLDLKQRRTLLQILAKQFIVSTDGEIIDQVLYSPFTYLTRLVKDIYSDRSCRDGSTTVRLSQPP